MKKFIAILLISLTMIQSAGAYSIPAPPPPIFGLVTAAIKKAIKAIDLKIQRLQNKTIWLQNTQKQIENTLSKLKLNEISEWTKKQKELYKGYYDELQQVKSIISYYKRIRDITEKQEMLVSDYHRYWQMFLQDSHFTEEELSYMQKVYGGILSDSLENMEQIFMIIESFSTQMTDAQRLKLINDAADRIDSNYNDLATFNKENIMLSLQRSKSKEEAQKMKRFYGLQ
ncbi:conjugal transfer protein TraI [Flavobacterium sp. fv08]|uniref:conjugal transfer protein TraI n=1 Tax=Flavobacterium sp. fv08 TaxID=1761784 RepID=UPI0008B3823C|nr:conjugal transfer protein TraI [Flavobacterium sp. fv08]SEP06858.1 hypothetical protein SAMN04487978_4375 [Flavobacterium sp. fv08]